MKAALTHAIRRGGQAVARMLPAASLAAEAGLEADLW
jgi:hypothetical protein